jgi:threonylcarbamoyladenosine tRNA methylthiotransferase MtaB
MTDSKTFKIITLGCKVNQYESAYFEEAMRGAGWDRARGDEAADAVIVNTCIVTQTAAHQSRQAIRKAIRQNPDANVAAVGCYAQVFPEELAEIEGLDLIADNRMKVRVPGLLVSIVSGRQEGQPDRGGNPLTEGCPTSHESLRVNQQPVSGIEYPASRTTVDMIAGVSPRPALLLKGFEPGARFDVMDISWFPSRARAYLKIQDGCESFCSYCIVPFARGPYRSLPPDKVLGSLERLSKQGYGEVVLTGIHLGKYGVDAAGDVGLVSLLKAIGKEGFPLRIRLSSIEPHELNRELIDMTAAEPWLCRHFHMPLQSGDDRVLKRMNRRYTTREFADAVRAIHARIPHAAMGVDIMVGFPGEDALAHDNTFTLLKDLPVSYFHVFPFSPRPGTAAYRFKGRVGPDEIKKRAARLRVLGETKRRIFFERSLDREWPVLAERWESSERGLMRGRSDNYLPVVFPLAPDAARGPFRVRVDRIDGPRLIGTAV